MKGNKKILIATLLLLIVTIGFGTYAIYRSSSSGTGTVKASGWSAKVKKGSGTATAMETATLDFTLSDVTWTTNPGANNTIAPGSTGTITFEIDLTGSEVDTSYTASVGQIKVDNSNYTGTAITASVTTGSSGTIAYNASSMKATVVVTVAWAGAVGDNSTKDTSDKALQGKTITIPVTLTAQQSLANPTGA